MSRQQGPGVAVIFGSGETSFPSRAIYDWVASQLQPPVRVGVLETPAGFEPNSAQVAGRVSSFLAKQLCLGADQVGVIPARARGTPQSPDAPEVAAPLYQANLIHMGAGSPTYAVRQLRDSLAWQVVQARHRLGAAVVFASAGAVAAGTHCLPVYEIYKVGADLHWQPGLDFFGAYGLNLAVIPHWNNNAGGAELDTGRCYMGEERFARLRLQLPPETVVVGVDESTALLMDLAGGKCHVAGQGGVTVLREGIDRQYETRAVFAMGELGPFRLPAPGAGLPPEVWSAASAAARPAAPRAEVLDLVQQREQLRAARDWTGADRVRQQLRAQGWLVEDTPSGPRVRPRT
jgi:cyanophycinase-like exopeptidase